MNGLESNTNDEASYLIVDDFLSIGNQHDGRQDHKNARTAPCRPKACLLWYPTSSRCQVKSTRTAQAQIHASLGVLPVAHVLWLSPTGDSILVLRTECPGERQFLSMGTTGRLQLLHIFFLPPNSLPTALQQLPSHGTSSAHCSELIFACTAGHRAVASHQQRVMRRFVLFFPTLRNFKTTEENEGRVGGKMGAKIPS